MKKTILIAIVMLVAVVVILNFSDIWYWLLKAQKASTLKIQSYINDVRNGDTKKLLYIMAAGFMYGIFHGAGPGHGKAVIAAYFLSQKASYSKGILMGVLISIIHAASSVITVLTADKVISMAAMRGGRDLKLVASVSYAAITIIGIAMFINGLISIVKNGKDADEKTIKGSYWLAALAAGAVPCPGILLFLFYTMANNILWIGIIIVTAVTAGIMAVTVATGLGSIFFRNSLTVSTGNITKLQGALKISGSLLMIATGVVLFFR